MRILWVSDAPGFTSSWAEQTKLLVPRLQAAGYEIIVYGMGGTGQMVDFEGMRVLPTNRDVRADFMGSVATQMNCDMVLTLKSLHVFNHHTLRSLSVPWCPVVAVEMEPLAQADRSMLMQASVPLAMSPNGKALIEAEGMRPLYTPLGIETAFWTPSDKTAARQQLGLPPDVFVVAFVGANQTRPSRKSIEQILIAWASFLELKPAYRDAVLYMHTDRSACNNGVNIDAMLSVLGLPQANVRFCDQLAYVLGGLPPEQVRDLYRAADVLLNPAAGGGFELAQVEAQACGCPVISTHWTAMRDTNWSGWQIATDRQHAGGEPMWTELGGFWFRPTAKAIVQTLIMAYEARGNADIAQKAREGAQQFDIDHVVQTHWIPALKQLDVLFHEANLGESDEPDTTADAA